MQKSLNLLKILQNKKFPIILGIVLAVIVLLLIVLELITPVCKGEEKMIVIEKGWGSGEIAQKLKDENLIKSKWFFVFYVWFQGYNNHLQAGEYLLNPQMTVFEIAENIAKGRSNPNWVKITIPEGWTNKQIENQLIESGVIKSEDKLLKGLEGYLFPDTYYFYKNSSIEDVIKKMRDNFDKKITEDLKEEIEKQSKTLSEIIILASIVQNEVLSIEDMKIIAGIFYNRLKMGMALQSDATVNYVTGKGKRQPSAEDIKVDSPYNTYLYRGLPPGPISNPGLDAIKAVIYPQETDYMYFLNPLDNTTIFSKTLEEHNQNKAKYLNKLDKRIYPN